MSTTSTPTGTKTYAIDIPHSQIGFSVKHMMFSTVRGEFHDFHGTIVIDYDTPENSSVDVTIDAASISTRDEKRDAHLRSADFFDVEKYPTLTFKSTSIDFDSPDDFTITGDLTMHGITHSVEIEAEQTGHGTNPWGIDVAGFEGKTKVNRKHWDLNWNTPLDGGGVLLGDDIKITLELELNEQQ